MIRHIFTIIWNERKTNGWILLEYILVFCILWFCVDYLCFMVKSYREPLGFDIEHVYQLEIGTRSVSTEEIEGRDNIEDAYLFMNRVSQYPGVTAICLANQGVPYSGGWSTQGIISRPDSLVDEVRVRWVTSGFFDVFKMNIQSGRVFNEGDEAEGKNVLISPDRAGCFGKYPGATTNLSQVSSITNSFNKDVYQVIGAVGKVKDTFFDPYKCCVYYPFKRENFTIRWSQIAIRIAPEADKGFSSRFMKEMKRQLEIGPYYLSGVTSFKDVKKAVTERRGINDRLNGIYAIMAFLVINIFLGLIGTFWYRTQSRRSEIGLRIALGASRQNVERMMFLETLFLLFIASVIAVNICLNIGQHDVLGAFDIPVGDRVQSGSGIEQDFLNYGLTFLFLAIVSLIAVWYPARQSSDIPPAEALREE